MKAMKAAFVLAVAVLVSASSVPVAMQSSGPAQDTPQRVYRPGIGVGFPTLLRQEQPVYTDAARNAGIEGVVVLEGVVLADGTVGDLRVVRSLDKVYGLDANAMSAAKRWLFRPAFRDGKAVPVIVTLELQYRLPMSYPVPAGLAVPPAPTTDDEFLNGAFSSGTPGLVLPKLVATRHPRYTSDAMRAKIQGLVEVEAVVGIDGTIVRSRIKRSLDKDLGLDQEALAAASQFTFDPGRLNGQAVPVVVSITLEFKLHSNR